MIESKLCIACKLDKPLTEFHKNKRTSSGYQYKCKLCVKDYDARRYEDPEHKEKIKTRARDWTRANKDKVADNCRKWLHGVSGEQYRQVFDSQAGRCGICNKHQDELPKRLAWDHCHTSGKGRGLLCSKCNMALGQLGDSIEGVERALAYLKRESNAGIHQSD